MEAEFGFVQRLKESWSPPGVPPVRDQPRGEFSTKPVLILAVLWVVFGISGGLDPAGSRTMGTWQRSHGEQQDPRTLGHF